MLIMKKKKLIISVSSILLLSTSLISVVSCSKNSSADSSEQDKVPQYVISFTSQDSFDLNLPTLEVNDKSIESEWIKTKVIENKDNIFKITTEDSNYIDDAFFSKNISIDDIQRDQENGTISFNCILWHYKTNILTSINKTIKFIGFKTSQNLPQTNNQEILEKCKKALRVTCNLSESEKSQTKPSEAIKKYTNFSVNTDVITSLGGYNNGYSTKIDDNFPNSVFIITKISVGDSNDPDYCEDTVETRIDGFKRNFEIGQLDALPNNLLSTPSGATSWKGKIGMINTNPIGTNAFKDQVKKYTLDDYEKDFVYHARFILYQSFLDNFSEINYYSQKQGNTITITAEGIIKKEVSSNFKLQVTGESNSYRLDARAGDKVTIIFNINSNPTLPFSPIDSMDWSFSQDFNTNSTANSQFGITFPSYSLTVKKNDSILSNISYGHLRTYSFVIGRTKSK